MPFVVVVCCGFVLLCIAAAIKLFDIEIFTCSRLIINLIKMLNVSNSELKSHLRVLHQYCQSGSSRRNAGAVHEPRNAERHKMIHGNCAVIEKNMLLLFDVLHEYSLKIVSHRNFQYLFKVSI